jgi:hypothetical protein
MDNISPNLSANLDMYLVDDCKTIPELLFRSDLLVLVYAGKETEGLGNLPQLQKELKNRKHKVKLPEMVLLRLDEVMAYDYDEDKGVRGCALKLIKACGDTWPWCQTEKEERLNADGSSTD